MTLIEAVLRSTGCTDVSALADVPAEKQKQLAAALYKLEAERFPLEQWNALLVAFGSRAAQTPGNARIRLIRHLMGLSGGETGGQQSSGQQSSRPQSSGLQSSRLPSSGSQSSLAEAETAAETVPKPALQRKTEAKPAEKPAPAKKSPAQEKQKSLFMQVWNVFTTVLVAVVVVLAATLAGVRLTGLQVFTVLSGSMEPVYHVGALIYVKSIDPAELVVGDDITFLLDEDTVATHRIIEVVPDENDPSTLRFRTQGVANEHEDGSLVHYKNVIG
ncbi:MAG: signal peptidase I, partial [Clostridia bacterium]|nr:signal peptidase I [Clostridia bacterium]